MNTGSFIETIEAEPASEDILKVLKKYDFWIIFMESINVFKRLHSSQYGQQNIFKIQNSRMELIFLFQFFVHFI